MKWVSGTLSNNKYEDQLRWEQSLKTIVGQIITERSQLWVYFNVAEKEHHWNEDRSEIEYKVRMSIWVSDWVWQGD